MVRIEKDKFVIEVESALPAEGWLDAMRDLISLVQVADKERVDNRSDCIFGACELLEAMLPSEEQARKLIEG